MLMETGNKGWVIENDTSSLGSVLNKAKSLLEIFAPNLAFQYF